MPTFRIAWLLHGDKEDPVEIHIGRPFDMGMPVSELSSQQRDQVVCFYTVSLNMLATDGLKRL